MFFVFKPVFIRILHALLNDSESQTNKTRTVQNMKFNLKYFKSSIMFFLKKKLAYDFEKESNEIHRM